MIPLLSLLALGASDPAVTGEDAEGRRPYRSVAYDRGPVTLPKAPVPSPAAPATRAPEYVGGERPGDREPYGIRAEARIGWDRAPLVTERQSDGVLYGAGLGYDHRRGRLFFGPFAGLDFSTAEARASAATTPSGVGGEIVETAVEAKATHEIEAGLRAGAWLTPSWNLYGGAAWTKAEFRADLEQRTFTPRLGGGFDESAPVRRRETASVEGWRGIVGTETEIASGFYAKAEYRYTDYGDDIEDDAARRHQLVTGMGLRF